MDCFRFMKEIYYDTYGQFIEEVDAARMEMLQVDKTEIQEAPKIIDLYETEKLSDGRWDTIFENIKFECFFHYKELKRLYVVLNGALVDAPPRFTRWSYYKFLSGSMLNIADPMNRFYEELMLGWYYGDEKMNLHQVVARLVVRVAELLNISPENIVFFGSSGGGTAAIECAHWIPGAKVIAINPQIVLKEYWRSKDFFDITGLDLSLEDSWHRNNAIYYLQNSNNVNLLFVNIRSKLDMRQIENICNNMNIKVKYGLNVFGHIIIWLYDGDLFPFEAGHSVQGNYCICFLLEWFIAHSDDRKDLQSYEELVNLVNEFYYEILRTEKKWRSSFPDLQRVVQCSQLDRKIAVWGKGAYLNYLNNELFRMEKENPYSIEYVIDNDDAINGTYCGVKIIHPPEIENWKDYFIIITTKAHCSEIRQQLEMKGLLYCQDFIVYTDLYRK